MNARSRSHRHVARAAGASCDSVSSLYSYPAASDTLPVYEHVSLAWDPACVTIPGAATVDLYLNVQQDSGLVAVHEWTDVNYAAGKLDTMLKPSWWNASTGAGSVQAQVRSFNLRVRAAVSQLTPFPLALDRPLWSTNLEYPRSLGTSLHSRVQRVVSRQLSLSHARRT